MHRQIKAENMFDDDLKNVRELQLLFLIDETFLAR